MRIISGKYRGKKLIQPIDKNTRPLKDLTKESIFNLILHSKNLILDIQNSNILDLFSGSGSFGLECLSRNAKHVTFIENYKPAIKILKKNVKLLKIENKYDIIEKNIFLKETYEHINKKYDFIFLDPPYKEEKVTNIFSFIADLKIINKKGIIAIHRNKKSKEFIHNEFNQVDSRIYGISKIIFYKLR